MADGGDGPASDVGGGRPAPQRLSFADRYAILRIRRASPDLAQAEIARIVGVSPMTVSRVLAAHEDDIQGLTKLALQLDVPQRLEEWAAASQEAALKGRHEPARDWLIHAGAIEPAPAAQLSVGFQVVLAPRFGTPTYAVNEPAPAVVCSADAPRAPLAGASLSAQDAPALDAPALNAPRAVENTPRAVHDAPRGVENALRTTHHAQRAPAPTPTPRIRRARQRTE